MAAVGAIVQRSLDGCFDPIHKSHLLHGLRLLLFFVLSFFFLISFILSRGTFFIVKEKGTF